MKSIIALVLVVTGLSLAGCLNEGDVPVVVVPRTIYQPAIVYYRALDDSHLEIRWTRSVSDTQLNFKGYYIELWRSTIDSTKLGQIGYFDKSIYRIGVDSVYRTTSIASPDTSCVFTLPPSIAGKPDSSRLTAKVWGVRYPPQSKPDSLVTSQVFSAISFDNDPTPVLAPGFVNASSAGQTSINLSWPRSASEHNKGFSGYVIRYIDTIKQSGAQLVYLSRKEKDEDSLKLPNGLVNIPVNVPVNPQTLTFREYPYRFYVKAIRKDSVESADSVWITWSGAEHIAAAAVRLDTGVFVGQVNTAFAIAQGLVSNPSVEFAFHLTGTTLSVSALNGTSFATRLDTLDLNQAHFSAPLLESDFSVTSLDLSSYSTAYGITFYALLPGKNRVRVHVIQGSDGLYTAATGTVSIEASFQPGFTGWPFF